MRDLLRRLYSGENDVDFMAARRRVGIATVVLLLIMAISLFTRGLDLGIEFDGGVVWEVPQGEGVSIDDVRDAVADAGISGDRVQTLSSGSTDLFRVRAGVDELAQSGEVTATLAELNGVAIDDVSRQEVGPSWGDEITRAARNALIWFLIAIALYVTVRFEWRMAIAALVAVFHDVLISVGVYSVFQLDVTPATVIAFLTILGYSLYDTIVVFDKVKANAELLTARGNEPYDVMVNRSLNEVIMRSINTSITSVLPVLSMLVVGAWILGAGALQEFALALLIGMLAGTYSSVFIAAPVLAWLHRGHDAALANPTNRATEALPVDHPMARGVEARPRKRGRR